jgi:Peptidase family M1 domain
MSHFIRFLTFLFLLLLSCAPDAAIAQKKKDYFQQQTDYQISVNLDDKKHILSGNYQLVYTNHSTEKLRSIPMLLWANAFSTQNSAYSREQLQNGNADFYFADTSQLARYSGLAWKINGKTVEATPDPQNPDILQLQLTKALGNGESVTITTPFQLRLPKAFSGFGHLGQAYFATHWYPRPAVFDAIGWHTIPYLQKGESYSDFGKFDVTITLPDNYVVAATGKLMTTTEQQFLQKVAQNTEKKDFNNVKLWSDTFPRSSDVSKTIRFTAENVTAFAFFADKRFEVIQSEVKLKSGRKIPTYGYFVPAKDSVGQHTVAFLNRTVQFYSDLLGEYPYEQASVIIGNEDAAYPMFSVIKKRCRNQHTQQQEKNPDCYKPFDRVIAYTVAHSWFAHTVASNGRDHAWMSEGTSQYYANRYIEKYYPTNIDAKSDYADWERSYLVEQYGLRNVLTDGQRSIQDLAQLCNCVPINKAAQAFALLEKYQSTASFDNTMRAYYGAWKGKHPQPADLQNAIEKNSTEQFGWWFRELIITPKKVDYAITHAREEGADMILTIQNKGDAIVPFQLAAMQGNKVVVQKWINGFLGEQTVTFRRSGYDMIVIDAEHLLPDLNRSNNQVRCDGILKQIEPLRVLFGTDTDHSRRTNIGILPILAFNTYDKFMLGVLLKNNQMPEKNLYYVVAPAYSFDAKRLVGMASVQYRFLLDGQKQLHIGANAKQFGYDQRKILTKPLNYQKFDPFVQFNFGEGSLKQTLRYRFIHTNAQITDYDTTTQTSFVGNEKANIHELTYTGERREALGNLFFKVGLEQQSYVAENEPRHYLKLNADVRRSWLYSPNHAFEARFFLGAFLDNTGRRGYNVLSDKERGSISTASLGFNDYRFDQIFIGRNETDGIAARQVNPNAEGGMKYNLNGRGDLGLSNNFVVAANFKVDLPIKKSAFINVQPYLDFAYYSNTQPSYADATFGDQFLYSGGLAIGLLDNFLNLYVPIVNSKNISNKVAEGGGFLNTITFSIDFSKLSFR